MTNFFIGVFAICCATVGALLGFGGDDSSRWSWFHNHDADALTPDGWRRMDPKYKYPPNGSYPTYSTREQLERWRHQLPAWAKRTNSGEEFLDIWRPDYLEPAMRYNYLPKHDLLLCACDKCGTTSLYDFVYRALYHKPWSYQDEPWMNDIYSYRWDGNVRMIWKEELATPTHRLAVVRDPIQRLVSGWKSKFACDEFLGANHSDDSDRQRLVPQLYQLAKKNSTSYCMWIDEYAQLLLAIHRKGNSARLNAHIRPQQHGCFRDLPRDKWTVVATISDPDFERALGDVLHAPNVKMGHVHSSPASTKRPDAIVLTPETRAALLEVTKEEYKAVGLKQPTLDGPRLMIHWGPESARPTRV